jgi:aconitate decarboxylase
MSAQFSSDTKRMQHGFAAGNGLFAALLAAGGTPVSRKCLIRVVGFSLRLARGLARSRSS